MDKKEAKLAWKNAKRAMGIYQIRNTVNGKVLVGSSPDLEGRRNRFAFEMRNGSLGKNRILNEELKRFGPDCFVFEVLDQLETEEDDPKKIPEELEVLEAAWPEKVRPFNERGYNTPPQEGR